MPGACWSAWIRPKAWGCSPTGGLGRLVFTSRYGPTALPVAYKIDGGSLILGTWNPVFDEELRTGIAHADYHVAVEADQIDLQAREGWVVLVRGGGTSSGYRG